MSQTYNASNHFESPQPPRKRKFRTAFWAIPAIIVTFAIGAAAGSSGKAEATPAPAPTVTTTATATVTATEQVKVPVTPAACSLALTKGEKVQSDYYDVVQTVVPAITAMQNSDPTTIQIATNRVKTLSSLLQTDIADYQSAAATCKGS